MKRTMIACALALAACNADAVAVDEDIDPVSSSDGEGSSSSTGAPSNSGTGVVGDSTSTGEGWSTAYEDDGMTGCGFQCPPIPPPPGGGGGGGFAFECSFFTQNCMEGELCSAWSNDGGPLWNASRCAPLDPQPAQVGEPCAVEGSMVSGIHDCDVGLQCLPYGKPTALTGRCAQFCDGLCAGDGELCVPLSLGALPICTTVCDPLDADACAPGWTCEDTQVGAPLTFVCQPRPPVETFADQLDACEYPTQCGDGLICTDEEISSGALGTCLRPCDTTGPDDCDQGFSCTPVDAFRFSPWAHVGYCIP